MKIGNRLVNIKLIKPQAQKLYIEMSLCNTKMAFIFTRARELQWLFIAVCYNET